MSDPGTTLSKHRVTCGDGLETLLNDPQDPHDPYETTETHVERLLGRALNSFDLPDSTVERLGTALAHSSALHSSHHSASLHRATYRHTYLLSDGSALSLWELTHDAGRDGAEQHELYTEESEARLAASRLPSGPLPGWTAEQADGRALDEDDDLELLSTLLARPIPAQPRMYVPDNSADHARRVLRRAENADRPGEATARLLRLAFAHHITQAFGRHCPVEGAGTPDSPSTSTSSCCSTAARPVSGRSSTRRHRTDAICARCTRTRGRPATRWSPAPGSAEVPATLPPADPGRPRARPTGLKGRRATRARRARRARDRPRAAETGQPVGERLLERGCTRDRRAFARART